MSNNKILSKFNEVQLEHVRSLSNSTEVCHYASSIGVTLTNEEANQILGEIGDRELESINGGRGRITR